jgi:hypothetical protein
MVALELCPEKFDSSSECKLRFCKYRNNKGQCSLDIELDNTEYEIGLIADILQVSRQRVWRIYDTAVSKLQIKLQEHQ